MSSTKSQTKALPASRPSDDTDVPEWMTGERVETIDALAQDVESDAAGDAGDQAAAGEPIEGEVQAGKASATPALDNLLQWLADNVTGTGEDDLSGMEAIIREVLSADDMAAVFREKLATSAEKWIDAPLLLTGYTIRESDYEDGGGLPFYMSLEVTCGAPNPEQRIINTGSIKVMAQVKRLTEIGTWPVFCKFVEAAKAKKGQSAPLKLALLDE